MSFRRRLTLFFVLIVVLPMVAVATLVLQVAGASQTGKSDARLAAGLETALSLYRAELGVAERAAADAAADSELTAEIADGQSPQLRQEVARVMRENDLAGFAVLDPDGETIARAGGRNVVASAEVQLERGGEPQATLVASALPAAAYVNRVRELTGRNATVSGTDRVLASTAPVEDAALPAGGRAETVEVSGEELRAASATLGRAGGEPLALTLFAHIEAGGLAATRPLVAAALAAFFAIALVFVAMLMRALQGQVGAMLGAARRIGSGDFSVKLPVEGKDEMAGLASEFNRMSARLSAQVGELRRQRVELEQSVRRIGEAFASGLDRTALLEIVAETAVSACEADHARVLVGGDPPHVEARVVTAGSPLQAAMEETARTAERDALESGGLVEVERDGVHAIAHPLHGAGEGLDDPAGVMTVVRRGPSFDREKRDVLRYLIGQAAVSIENVELHERIAEQAVTDGLTGLSNNRRFRSWIEEEVARAERFGHQLSLLLLDIDDFKEINDTHGHLQGDEVLRAIGRVLREESRGIDEPARYGGEEFVIGLPETDTQGALELAERVRSRIERLEVPMVGEGAQGVLRVTTSIGAAATPPAPPEPRALIEQADQALYRAKRAGKNRTELAAAGSADPPGDGSAGTGPRTAKMSGES